MDVAFIEHAQHDVHREQRRQNQPRHIGERRLERLRGALKAAVNVGGHANLTFNFLRGIDGFTKRHAQRQIERERHRWKLPLVIDTLRRHAGLVMNKCA